MREREREGVEREIYKMVGVLSLAWFIAVVKRKGVFTESINTKKDKRLDEIYSYHLYLSAYLPIDQLSTTTTSTQSSSTTTIKVH